VPVPGPVTIDGKLDDWDLSGRVLVCSDVETKRDLKVGYKVRARVVSLSLSEISPRDSRIGLTMRQPALGRLEWIQEAHKKADEKSGKRPPAGAAAKKPVAKPVAPAAAKPAAPAAAKPAGRAA
jgi:hypothetical protein